LVDHVIWQWNQSQASFLAFGLFVIVNSLRIIGRQIAAG
jgi:hypothetical protein